MNFIMFHSEDHDGQGSAGIYQLRYILDHCPNKHNAFYDNNTLIPLPRKNYVIPWERIQPDSNVFIFDFNLDLDDWRRLLSIIPVNQITWIDHHLKNYTDDIRDIPELAQAHGIRANDKSASGYCWDYFFADVPIPPGLQLLSDYDNWNDDDKEYFNSKAIPFEYGLRTFNADPDKWIQWLLVDFNDPAFIGTISEIGNRLNYYLTEQYEKNMWNAWDIEYDGMKAIMVNTTYKGSHVFGDKINDYDFCIAFRLGKEDVSVSFYSVNTDVSLIAKKYGGGGHDGASGCSMSKEQFKKDFMI